MITTVPHRWKHTVVETDRRLHPAVDPRRGADPLMAGAAAQAGVSNCIGPQ